MAVVVRSAKEDNAVCAGGAATEVKTTELTSQTTELTHTVVQRCIDAAAEEPEQILQLDLRFLKMMCALFAFSSPHSTK